IDLLARAAGLQLVALFSPEHGLAGRANENVASSKDPTTGLSIYSLYGDARRPTDEMLQGVDALVFDIQDAGVRFYTYTVTMAYCMEEAAKRQIPFFVLDRPNPLGGEIVEGPMLDPDKTSFVAYFPIPVRYGLTIGELAQFFNAENHIGAELHVIAMRNWHRNYFFESTGINWVPPSPALRTTKGSILYPGIEVLQASGVSVGRGTQAPFEEFGANTIFTSSPALRESSFGHWIVLGLGYAMRIVSLLPSATEILFALGLDREIVGVSHECDFPAQARKIGRASCRERVEISCVGGLL